MERESSGDEREGAEEDLDAVREEAIEIYKEAAELIFGPGTAETDQRVGEMSTAQFNSFQGVTAMMQGSQEIGRAHV